MDKLRAWFSGNAFQGQGIVFKSMRFLHLMETDAVVLSLTGLQMWATTILNIQMQIASHDHISQGIAAATNATAMAAHGVKRSQMLNAKDDSDTVAPDGPPPWQGEDTA